MSKEIQKLKNSELLKSSKKKLNLSTINTGALSASLSELSIPRLFYQLVVFVIDGTGSMTWEGKTGKSKGEEVNEIITKILERLDNSKNKNSFDIAVYGFAETHKTILDITQLTNIDYKQFDFNPTSYFTDGYMYEYLDDTLDIVIDSSFKYLNTNKEKNSQALIITLSDGAIKHFDTALERVEKLKQHNRITVSSVLLEDTRWEDDNDFKEEVQNKLKTFASNEKNGHNFFTSNISPEEIRKHMIKSISTVSKID
jgi:uncharacterized protein YegL